MEIMVYSLFMGNAGVISTSEISRFECLVSGLVSGLGFVSACSTVSGFVVGFSSRLLGCVCLVLKGFGHFRLDLGLRSLRFMQV